MPAVAMIFLPSPGPSTPDRDFCSSSLTKRKQRPRQEDKAGGGPRHTESGVGDPCHAKGDPREWTPVRYTSRQSTRGVGTRGSSQSGEVQVWIQVLISRRGGLAYTHLPHWGTPVLSRGVLGDFFVSLSPPQLGRPFMIEDCG